MLGLEKITRLYLEIPDNLVYLISGMILVSTYYIWLNGKLLVACSIHSGLLYPFRCACIYTSVLFYFIRL